MPPTVALMNRTSPGATPAIEGEHRLSGGGRAGPRAAGRPARVRPKDEALARCYARHRGVEPAVRRLELGETLLPDPHGLLGRRLRAGQADPVGLAPGAAGPGR